MQLGSILYADCTHATTLYCKAEQSSCSTSFESQCARRILAHLDAIHKHDLCVDDWQANMADAPLKKWVGSTSLLFLARLIKIGLRK